MEALFKENLKYVRFVSKNIYSTAEILSYVDVASSKEESNNQYAFRTFSLPTN